MEKNNKLLWFGLILGLSLVGSALLVSKTFLAVKQLDNVVAVSGSAKQQVRADSARWTGSFTRTVLKEDIKSGYAQMKTDETTVNDFFVAQGFADLEISPVFMNEVFKSEASAPKEYTLTQNITIKSNEVDKVKALAKNSGQLADKGVIFSANPVEYYYSKLPEMRVSLLPEAIKDAKARAEAVAQSSGKAVDNIKSVSMGVVQVMPVGAIDISDYGSYDTSSVDKEVMITVKANFGLK